MLSILNLKQGISRFFQSPLNIAIANVMPRKLYRLYFVLLGLAYLAFRKDIRRRISSCTRSVFGSEIGIFKQLKLKQDIYLGLVDHYFEKMWNIYSPLEAFCEYIKRHTVIQNRAWLDHSLRNCSGALLISGHFGGVEYLTITLSVHGYKPAIIARFKTAELLQKSLPRAKLNNIEIINADEPKAIFRAARVLKEGKILITLCDEFSHWIPVSNKSVTVFGESIPQDKTLDILHRRVNVPVSLGLMQRSKSGYKLEIHPISIPPPDEQNESIGNQSWKLLEYFILKYPGQWYQWQEVTEIMKNYNQKRK